MEHLPEDLGLGDVVSGPPACAERPIISMHAYAALVAVCGAANAVLSGSCPSSTFRELRTSRYGERLGERLESQRRWSITGRASQGDEAHGAHEAESRVASGSCVAGERGDGRHTCERDIEHAASKRYHAHVALELTLQR